MVGNLNTIAINKRFNCLSSYFKTKYNVKSFSFSDPIAIDLSRKIQKVDAENKRLEAELEQLQKKYDEKANKNGKN
jgi:Skp family chaperone for outer membrane proteins